MFADYFILGCTGICFFSTYKTLSEAFQARTQAKKIKRKLEYREILDISTILSNINRIQHESVGSWPNKKGGNSYLLVMRGNLHSDSTLSSRFRHHEKYLTKVRL